MSELTFFGDIHSFLIFKDNIIGIRFFRFMIDNLSDKYSTHEIKNIYQGLWSKSDDFKYLDLDIFSRNMLK
mgnify:CR=1 FL=1